MVLGQSPRWAKSTVLHLSTGCLDIVKVEGPEETPISLSLFLQSSRLSRCAHVRHNKIMTKGYLFEKGPGNS